MPARELLVARQEATLIGTELDPAGPPVAEHQTLAGQRAALRDPALTDDHGDPSFWRVLGLLGLGLAVGVGLLVAAARWIDERHFRV